MTTTLADGTTRATLPLYLARNEYVGRRYAYRKPHGMARVVAHGQPVPDGMTGTITGAHDWSYAFTMTLDDGRGYRVGSLYNGWTFIGLDPSIRRDA